MGGLTTHVLDTASGKPGHGIPLRLYRLDAPQTDTSRTDISRTEVCTHTTNSDGRTDTPLLAEESFTPGTYELVFEVAEYFCNQKSQSGDPPFLDEITLRFTISDASHYHVPLLVSPWSYSTYRGS